MYICKKCNKKWDAARAEENELSCTRQCGGELILVYNNRVSNIICFILLSMAFAYLYIDFNYFNTFWPKVISINLIFLVLPVLYSGLFMKSYSIEQFRSQNQKAAATGWILVVLVSGIIYFRHFFLSATFRKIIINGKSFLIAGFTILAVTIILRKFYRHIAFGNIYYYYFKWWIHFFTIPLIFLFIGTFFFPYLICFTIIMVGGGIIISRMIIRKVNRTIRLISHMKESSLYYENVIKGIYSPHPVMSKFDINCSVNSLNEMDSEDSGDISDNLIDCIEKKTIESICKLDDVNYTYFDYFDIYFIEFEETTIIKCIEEAMIFKADLRAAIESPRAQILWIYQGNINPSSDGSYLKNMASLNGLKRFVASDFGKSIIHAVKTKYGAGSDSDRIRIVILQQIISQYRLNNELFSSISNEQYQNIKKLLKFHITPISGLGLRLLRTNSETERYYVLINLYEAQIRWLAIVAIAIVQPERLAVYQELSELLKNPSMEKWVNAIRLVEPLIIQMESTPLVNLIKNWFNPIAPPESYRRALEAISEITGAKYGRTQIIKPIQLIEAVIALRNKTVGHGSVTYEIAKKATNLLFIAFVDILEHTKHKEEIDLILCEEKIYSYTGMKSFIDNYEKELSIKDENGVYLNSKKELIKISPWLTIDNKQNIFWFYNGQGKNYLEYLSYETGGIKTLYH